MKKLIALAIAAGATIVAVAPAEAAQGCGAGYHRGPAGRCRPNVPPRTVVVAPGGLVVGNYYRGRGYWDGRRYWQHRYRHNNGWRYR